MRKLRASLILSALGTSFMAGACLLAEPIPDSPQVAGTRPSIVAGRVTPGTSAPLRVLPDEFQVPIELGNPRQRYDWSLLIDQQQFLAGTIGGTENSANLQVVRFAVDNVALRDGCHRLEFQVQNVTTRTLGGVPQEADSISWQYVPLAIAGLCTPYDGGGNDGAFPDVQSDR